MARPPQAQTTRNYSSLYGPRLIPRLGTPPRPPPARPAASPRPLGSRHTTYTQNVIQSRVPVISRPRSAWSTLSESSVGEDDRGQDADDELSAPATPPPRIGPALLKKRDDALNTALERLHIGPPGRRSPSPEKCAICFTRTDEVVAGWSDVDKGGVPGDKLLWKCDQPKCSASYCLSCFLKWNHIAAKGGHPRPKWHCPTCTRSQDHYHLRHHTQLYAPDLHIKYFGEDKMERLVLGNEILTGIAGYFTYYCQRVTTRYDMLHNPRAIDQWDQWFSLNAFRYDAPAEVMTTHQRIIRNAGYIPFIARCLRHDSPHANFYIRMLEEQGHFGPHLTDMLRRDLARLMAIRLFEKISVPRLQETIDRMIPCNQGHLVFLCKAPRFWIGVLHPHAYRYHSIASIPFTPPLS